MIEKIDDREGADFFLNNPQKLDNPFPDFKYFRENRPIFYYPPLNSWFIFRYDDVANLFHDPRLSSDRMKGFVDAAPAEVHGDLRKIAPFLETWVIMKDGQDHTRMREFLNLDFNATVIHGLAGADPAGHGRTFGSRAGSGLLGRVCGFCIPTSCVCPLRPLGHSHGRSRQGRAMVGGFC